MRRFGTFSKKGVLNLGVLIMRILLFGVLYQGPLFSETPMWLSQCATRQMHVVTKGHARMCTEANTSIGSIGASLDADTLGLLTLA